MIDKKEEAKSTFIECFAKLEPAQPDSVVSLFKYVRSLDLLLENFYNTAFNEGFQKALDMDVNQK